MATQRWNIDTGHSGVHFTVRHMVVAKVRGVFSRWEGVIDFDEQDPSLSKVSVRIDASSIDTREEERDAHLRSADFLDAEKFPHITFESTKVEKRGDNEYAVTGNLSIHGITRPAVLESEYLGGGKDPWGQQRIGFQAKTSINRKDFGLNWNQMLEAGGVLVGDKLEIELDIEGVKAQADDKAA